MLTDLKAGRFFMPADFLGWREERGEGRMEQSELFELIRGELDSRRMTHTVKELGKWHRYTGSEAGESCVDYLIGEIKKEGIPVRVDSYEALVSLPQEAGLILDSGEAFCLTGDVYSSTAQKLVCELIYDTWSERKWISGKENEERFAAFKGKLVLTRESGGDFAERLYRAGAAGMLHISSSPGGYIHHSNIGAEWGTPCASQISRIVSIPSAGISLEDGQMLAKRLETGSVTCTLSIRMDTRVRTSRMPYIDIPGKRKTFVLINGHYDSWYEGITDNATSDAILLEYARVFWKYRNMLDRGVRIAWWSGHSDARYAGSAWYCDRHLKELRDNCVANLNLDLAGNKNAEQVRARTTCMEGTRLTAEVIEEYTGMDAKPYIPMIRGADQSFWGARIPIQIMLKYEPTDEKRISPCPGGGPWWHTDQDTIDKMDEQILLRDAEMNAKIACRILNSTVLPVEMVNYAGIMRKFLENIRSGLSDDFYMEDVFGALDELEPWLEKLERKLREKQEENPGVPGGETGGEECDRIIKRVAGEMTRLVYTYGSPYGQDRSTPYQPFGVLKNAVWMTRENTPDAAYLFQMTEFKRACNRIEGQLEEVVKEVKGYLS